ncbi:MAG: helix-turn-helix domain-containing protein [Gemmatimonadetes bacterium]|nr:helix-turn-helix domain-containing protein [Gemmatimonadota bacterium]
MDNERKIHVGKRLQEIRGSRDQRTFAEAVDSVQQTISKYERGEIPRSWLFLARLAEEEGIDLNFLLTGERQAGGLEDSSSEGNGNGLRSPRRAEERSASASYAEA